MNRNLDSMNLLFSVSRSYLGSFVCSMKSILLHGGYAHYHVYILHSCFDDNMMDAMRRDFGNCVSFHFIQVSAELLKKLPSAFQSSPETYYRFLAPFLLPPELDQILYLDADTVVINSLHELYELSFEDHAIVGCTHIRDYLSKINHARQQSGKALLHLDPGVMLLNLPYLRSQFCLDDLIQCVSRKKTNIVSPDQFILTSLCGNSVKLAEAFRFNLSENLLNTYNAGHRSNPIDLQWIRTHGVIIHYSGFPKPGNAGYAGTLKVFYDELMESSKCRSQ